MILYYSHDSSLKLYLLSLFFVCSLKQERQSIDLTKGQIPGEEFTNISQVSYLKK